MVAGVALIALKLVTIGIGELAEGTDRITGVRRREFSAVFWAHANPPKSTSTPAIANIINLRIPASFLHV
jgi:hypothetical protein